MIARHVALITLFYTLTGGAHAQELAVGPSSIIITRSQAVNCAGDALLAADGKMAAADALVVCDAALDVERLSTGQRAATHVNRGVLHMVMNDSAQASQDFSEAARLKPDMSEAYVNRGAILLSQDKPTEALADLDKAVALSPKQPERAYFNRAMVKERLRDLPGALADYRMAVQLKPDWTLAQEQVARFEVRPVRP